MHIIMLVRRRSSVDASHAILQTEQVLTLKIIHKIISIRAGVLIFVCIIKVTK